MMIWNLQAAENLQIDNSRKINTSIFLIIWKQNFDGCAEAGSIVLDASLHLPRRKEKNDKID